MLVFALPTSRHITPCSAAQKVAIGCVTMSAASTQTSDAFWVVVEQIVMHLSYRQNKWGQPDPTFRYTDFHLSINRLSILRRREMYPYKNQK
jgi:hypothetical protein